MAATIAVSSASTDSSVHCTLDPSACDCRDTAGHHGSMVLPELTCCGKACLAVVKSGVVPKEAPPCGTCGRALVGIPQLAGAWLAHYLWEVSMDEVDSRAFYPDGFLLPEGTCGDRCARPLKEDCPLCVAVLCSALAASKRACPDDASCPLANCALRHLERDCAYGEDCTRVLCQSRHTATRNSELLGKLLCRFAGGCTNAACGRCHPVDRNEKLKKRLALAAAPRGCRFGAGCTRADCAEVHPPERAERLAALEAARAAKAAATCRFGADCTRADCTFAHPSERAERLAALEAARAAKAARTPPPCKFGAACKKGAACPFAH